VTTKVVVIVENQDARIGFVLTEEVRGRQSTDPGAHNDQIVQIWIGLLNRAPITSPRERQLVGNFE
jgi:hypothetical protein